jgi:hypothetical protein
MTVAQRRLSLITMRRPYMENIDKTAATRRVVLTMVSLLLFRFDTLS